MRSSKKLVLIAGGFLICLLVVFVLYSQQAIVKAEEQARKEPSKLFVLWTSGDRDVAEKMVFMYTYNAKKDGWWDEIRFCVWGPSSKLLSVDVELQDYIGRMKDVGIELFACKACADMYGISCKLEELGLDLNMGCTSAEMLKTG